jgi:hypothetical protein
VSSYPSEEKKLRAELLLAGQTNPRLCERTTHRIQRAMTPRPGLSHAKALLKARCGPHKFLKLLHRYPNTPKGACSTSHPGIHRGGWETWADLVENLCMHCGPRKGRALIVSQSTVVVHLVMLKLLQSCACLVAGFALCEPRYQVP